LKIGGTITLESTLRERGAPMFIMPGEEDDAETVEISYTLTVVGYYDDNTDEYNEFMQNYESMQNAYENRRNEIITTINTLIAPMIEGFDNIRIESKYFLKNPADLDAFRAELYAKGLDEGYEVSTDEDSYNTIVKPVEGLKSITLAFLLVVLALGAIILILLSTISIRERKYEIGVLRAMGMKKSRVASGLLSEVVTITLVCLILGLGAGIAAAQPVSDMLLENQLEQIEEENANNMQGFGRSGRNGAQVVTGTAFRVGVPIGNMTPAEALKEMDVSMSVSAVAQIILVSLLLAVMSSIVGIVHITRYEPIKILSDRA
jgi:putative ABC transport system permease protein